MKCIRCGAEMNSTTGGNYTCPKCSMEVNDLVYRPQNCDMPLPQDFGKKEGWICPVCVRSGDTIVIDIGEKHKISATSDVTFIETQLGDILEESDIERCSEESILKD